MIVEEEYNEKHKKDYYAIRALFERKDGKETMLLEKKALFIRKKNKDDKEEDCFDLIETENDPHSTIFEKFMPIPSMDKSQRLCNAIIGQSGSGKSWLINDLARLYKTINPKNRILYFTLNSAEKDVSLDLSLYQVMPMQSFCDSLQEIFKDMEQLKSICEMFKDTYLIFDDIGALKCNKKWEKTYWDFLDHSIENFRKFNVSITVILHTSRWMGLGKILREEMTSYCVVGKAMQISNDRIIEAYFGLSKKEIRKLFDHNDRWIWIHTKEKIVIMPSKIYDIELLKD